MAGSETVVFEANVSKYVQAINKLKATDREMGRSLQMTAKAAAAGSKEAQAALGREYVARNQVRQAITLQKKELQQLLQQQTASSLNTGRFSQVLTQVTYAADDFANTIGPMGLSGAIRSVSNNLSVAAMAIHPLAGIATVAAGAMAGFALRSREAADETEGFGNAAQGATMDAEKFRQALERIQDTRNKIGKTPEQIGDEAFAAETQQAIEEQQQIQKGAATTVENAQREIKAFEKFNPFGNEQMKQRHFAFLRKKIEDANLRRHEAITKINQIQDEYESTVNARSRDRQDRMVTEQWSDFENRMTVFADQMRDYRPTTRLSRQADQFKTDVEDLREERKAAEYRFTGRDSERGEKISRHEEEVLKLMRRQTELMEMQANKAQRMAEDEAEAFWGEGNNLDRNANF